MALRTSRTSRFVKLWTACLLLFLRVDLCRAYSVRLAVTPAFRADDGAAHHILCAAFDDICASTAFLVRSPGSALSCRVPLLGDGVQVLFCPPPVDDNQHAERNPPPVVTDYLLRVEGCASTDDAGWIYAKFYESKEYFGGLLETDALRTRVVHHFNQQPAQTGYAAATAAVSSQVQDLFADAKHLTELQEQGYTVIDVGAPKTTRLQHARLSAYLVEKTNQGEQVRTDTVNFLDQRQAETCLLKDHFHLLMGIASYLNDNFVFRPSLYKPMEPATLASPLTIPRRIQLAEYEHGGFYTAHSDNSLQANEMRSNFRHFTCILYCNDEWQERDGGALRIYLGSREVSRPTEAKEICDHIDIFPQNGRLVLFDSCLFHSVERVKDKTKVRRALTLWINRPDESGVGGEQFF
jgi:Rps23 Pro-64 3,4-dihydroxylase Tpa1-like proline 4-hydroxylase